MSNLTYTVRLSGLADLDHRTAEELSDMHMPYHRKIGQAYALGYRLAKKHGLTRFDIKYVIGKGEDSYVQHTEYVYL